MADEQPENGAAVDETKQAAPNPNERAETQKVSDDVPSPPSMGAPPRKEERPAARWSQLQKGDDSI